MFQNLYSNPDFSVVYSNFTIILYYVIVLLSFICGYYIQYSYSQETKLILYNKRFFLHFHVNLFVLLFFLVSFISGVREIGNDYVNYIDIFERSNSLDRFFIGVEPGFIIYNGIIRFFTSNYYVFFLITSFLTVALFYISIVRYSEYVELSLAFGAYACVFYFQSFSLVRIYLASAILFYGTKYLFNQQNVKFFLIIVFAITIHTSSIFILLTFILYLLKCRSDRMFYILYVSIFLCSILLKDYLMILNISDRCSG